MGGLILSGLSDTSITHLVCSHNQISSLNIVDGNKIVYLNFEKNRLKEFTLTTKLTNLLQLNLADNYLKDLEFISSLPKELTLLQISNNNFSRYNISGFGHFKNLETLYIGNYDKEKWQKNIFNCFEGSLDSLKNLTKLKRLDIANTNIDFEIENLQNLPANLEFFNYFYDIENKNKERVFGKIHSDKLSIFLFKNKLRNHENVELISYEQFSNLEEIGKGGYGTVYKAERTKEKQISPPVALKVFKERTSKENLIQEFAKQQIISQGPICYGITQNSDGNYALVMEYCEYGNIKDYLEKNDVSFGDRIVLLINLCFSLSDLHKHNLIHGDFHPRNILLTKINESKKKIKVTDFGLSSFFDEEKRDKVFGIVPYIAPEVLQGQPYTTASDIYSFGIVAYELLTGLEPYHDYNLTEEELVKEIVKNNLRPKFNDGFLVPKSLDYLENNFEGFLVPKFLENLITSCWDSDPKKRPDYLKIFLELQFSEQEKLSELQKIDLFNKENINFKNWKIIQQKIRKILNSKNKKSQNEIKDIKSQLNSLKSNLNPEKHSLFDQFTSLYQQYKKDENNKELKKQIGKLEKQLKQDKDFKQIIQEIKNLCDKINK